jgi:hypothetical protein
VFAGAAKVPIEVPAGSPLAGYPGFRTAERDGIVYARALALRAGESQAVLVALETLLVPGELEAEVMRRAGLPAKACLMLAATHTHSGPGGTWRNALAEIGGNGRFDPPLRDTIAQAAADAVRGAFGALRLARFVEVREPWLDGPAVSRGPGPIDPQIAAVQARDDLGVIGTLVVYGMHPTVLPRSSRLPSGDWPAAAAVELERITEAPALVLQGAGGNATWSLRSLPHDAADAARALGQRVADRALRDLTGARERSGAPLRCEVRLLALPRARAGGAVPSVLRRGVSNLLGAFAEPFAVATRIELDGLALQGIPAEPVGTYGPGDAQLVGLADGYLGYVEEPARTLNGDGESARTYYGPDLARVLLEAP